ncbi:hypothetical protein [Streptomyces sp. NPDC059994]|uniref:hypothetical protein n=1 Tax=Streptomyces sp. NPDC059994 TaxID=3347029 RepID=UPI00369117C2
MAAGPDILAGGFRGRALPSGTSGRAVSVGAQAQLAGQHLTGDVQERPVVAEGVAAQPDQGVVATGARSGREQAVAWWTSAKWRPGSSSSGMSGSSAWAAVAMTIWATVSTRRKASVS